MPSFFLSFVACALVVGAGAESTLVSRLTAALGSQRGLMNVLWASAIATAAFSAALGASLAPMLPPDAKLVFAAVALAFASAELVLRRSKPRPIEPTRSLGAIFLVLLARQGTDAARFIVLALATATAAPAMAAAGGAAGSGAVLTIAALAGSRWEARMPLQLMRLSAAAVLGIAAGGLLIIGTGLIE